MIIEHEPIDQYHNSGAAGSTRARTILPEYGGSPAHFHDHNTGVIKREEKPCLDFGNACHWFFLEPHAFDQRVAVNPTEYLAVEKMTKRDSKPYVDGKQALEEGQYIQDGYVCWRERKPWNMNANACKDWCRQQAGKLLLSEEQRQVIDMIDARLRPEVRKALGQLGLVEPTIRINHEGFTTQARPDAWRRGHGHKTELKTTAFFDSFNVEAWKRGYHFQEAWCDWHILQETGEVIEKTEYIVLETVPPYRSMIRVWDHPPLAVGLEQVERAIECMRIGYSRAEWPVHLPGEVMLPPRWALLGEEYDDSAVELHEEVVL